MVRNDDSITKQEQGKAADAQVDQEILEKRSRKETTVGFRYSWRKREVVAKWSVAYSPLGVTAKALSQESQVW